MSLRIGIIGSAGHTGLVIDGTRELPDTRVCCVAAGCAEEDISQLAGKVPGAAIYTDYRDMLDCEKPDIVGVAPFFHLHAHITCEALARGIHVFCEKPLALNLDDLARVRNTVRRTKARVGMMLNFRYSPVFYTAHKVVAAGAIGEPTVGYAQKSYKRGRRPFFFRTRAGFGGIIPWVGIHAIDWLRWISGKDYTAVFAHHTKNHCFDYPEMEDAATCLYEMENGGSAVMSFDFLRPGAAPTHGDDRLRLAGEKGVIEIGPGERLTLITGDDETIVSPEKPPHGVFADFALGVVDHNHRCGISTDDALRVTEIAIKSRDAADSCRRVLL